jgi:hypothetical protein
MNRLTSREMGRNVARSLEKMPFELELDGEIVAVVISPGEYARLTSSYVGGAQAQKKAIQLDVKLADLPFSKKAQAKGLGR